ncbi:hypothetical protein GGF32_010027 [Allomyces javanicus]|nr:hypothetical protein GGF32_010027 [Allomyces javanicus]
MLDAILVALPRVGLQRFHMILDVPSSPDMDMELELTSIAATMPTTADSVFVQVICGEAINLDELTARIPLATQGLYVTCSRWTKAMFKALPVAPSLRQLAVQCRSASNEPLGLEFLVARLPASLVDLDLSTWSLSNTPALVLLARMLPRHLASLDLTKTGLTDADLEHLSDHWPTSLTVLSLNKNLISGTGSFTWPAILQVLKLAENEHLGDQATAWVTALPTSLMHLVVSRTQVGDRFAEALHDRMLQRSTWRQLRLWVNGANVSQTAIELLKEKVVVVK